MADSNKTVKYDITAGNEGFLKAMEEVAAATEAAQLAIAGSFGKVGEAFAFVTEHLAAMAALLGGGAGFAKGVDATKQLNAEAVKLSKALGVTTEDASVLNVMLREIGSSADDYASANAKLTRQLRTNEDGVKALGVQTRGTNGELLDGQQIMTNALKTLATYKEGTDRNLAAQVLFGKGAAETTVLLKLLEHDMEEAAKKAESLGLVIGPEQAARTKAYNEAIEGVHTVLLGIENAIGQAVMPGLTALADWFNDVGPAAVDLMRGAITFLVETFGGVVNAGAELYRDVSKSLRELGDIVTSVFGEGGDGPEAMNVFKSTFVVVQLAALAFKAGIVIVFEVIRSALLQLIGGLKMLAAVAVAAFKLDWGGVKAAWKAGLDENEKIIAESQKRILDSAAQTAEQMAALLQGRAPAKGAAKASTAPKPDGRSYKSPVGADSDLLKAQFAVIKATLEAELNLQKEYAQEAQEVIDNQYKHHLLSAEQFFDAKLKAEQASLAGAVNIKEKEIQEVQALEAKAVKPADKLALHAQEIKLIGQKNVLLAQSAFLEKKVGMELADAVDLRRRALAEIERLSTQQTGHSQIELERVGSEQRLALHQITDAQYLQEERDFQERLYAMDLKALQDRYALIDNDPVEKLKIDKQIEQLHRQHQVDMAKIDKDIIVETRKNMIDAQVAIEGAFTNLIASLSDHSKSLKDKLLDLVGSVEKALSELAAKNIAKQIFGGLDGGTGSTGGWLGNLLGKIGIPSFDVGTPRVPEDMLAVIHKNERIVTAKDNMSGNYGGRGGGISVVNQFHLSGPVDTRTQSQLAAMVGRSVQTALARNG